MDYIAEIESLDARIAGRDALFQEFAQGLGRLRELAEAGQEIVSGIAALISRVHAAPAVAGQTKPAVHRCLSQSRSSLRTTSLAITPLDAPPEEAGEQNKGVSAPG